MTLLKLFLPETILFITAFLIVITDVIYVSNKKQKSSFIPIVAIFGLTVALFSAATPSSASPIEIFSRTMVIDFFTQFFKAALIFCALVVAVLGLVSKQISRSNQVEFQALVCLSTLTACVSISAAHFLTLYLALEITSLLLYLLVSFSTESRVSSESGIRIFVFGSVMSLLFLLGVILLYAFTKSFNILDTQVLLHQGPLPASYFWIAFGLLFAAAAAKISLFPFHLLSPGVVLGAPTPVSALMCVAPPLVGLALAVKICFQIFSSRAAGEQWMALPGLDWSFLLAVTAAMTMTIANLLALTQRKIKKLLAYSSLAHMAYLLLGFVVMNFEGIGAVLFGGAVHLIAILGAFLVAMMCMDESGSDDVVAMRGLVWRHPFAAVAFSVFILSLAALPPFAGFVSRIYLLSVVMKQKIYWLAAIAAVNSVIGLTYYFHLLRLVFERTESKPEVSAVAPSPRGGATSVRTSSAELTMAILLVPTLFLGLSWDVFMNYISNSLKNILW